MIDIKEIRELCNKATPGPWSYKTNRHPNTNGTPWGWLEGPAGNMCWSGHQSRTDAEFIAKSREIIPALLDELEAAQNAHRWIPVTERLPEDVYGKKRKQITVLVRTGSGNVIACSRVRSYEWDKQKQRYVETKDKFNWNKSNNITHWMPMPEPPKGE